MFTAVVFEFSVMRCQPLRRALGANQFLEPSIIFMEKKCSLLVYFNIKNGQTTSCLS
ncbi:acetyltransferase [Vibrio anguillarum]|uniref:Acetyltransferase n=1 Tax=Vibrio anguillarum TaxID=55601 RepID=A0ABR9Z910_VIBAN|nr:acetyltransferase [Vibrio anguillarum]MBF4374906.1 acetyltransferase [Vibrio anguillarum]